ncbi:hypothetical protein Vadar_007871 [Vaccinium darrowii]|uniref:Uncharacterized protein n=1 Tax=Vaccinium darrowii TaxID=229202 RepID=A0ACB7YTT1_9ERIC|nr:hypothetical protein Vadar_007871 [Vaccinium darrowii]
MNRDDPKWKGKGIAETTSGGPKKRRHLIPRTHLIPGPAGLVQLALEKREDGEGVLEMNTQEAIHRAITVPSEDNAFVENKAWLAVVHGGYMFEPGYTNLASVNQMPNLHRLKLVVALVKSCVHDAVRGTMLELKDPTGSILGTVSEKAAQVYDGMLKAGVCIVLREIVLWRLGKISYLNITSANIETVYGN